MRFYPSPYAYYYSAPLCLASKGKCQVIIRELALETEGRPDVVLDMSSEETIAALMKTPLVVKEGIEYCIKVKFDVQNDMVSGLKYIQSVSRLGFSKRPLGWL